MTSLRFLLPLLLLPLVGCNQFNKLLPCPIRGTGEAAEDMTHIVVAGQSNGVSPGNSFGTLYSTTLRTHIKDIPRGDSTYRVRTPSNADINNISWEILGDQLVNQTGRDVYITNVSEGNTDSPSWARLYLSQLVSSIAHDRPNIIIWVQGESDALNGVSVDDAKAAYLQIFEAINQVKPVNCKVYTALDGFYTVDGGLSVEQAPARIAQRLVISKGLALPGPDVDAMRLSNWSLFTYVSHNASPGAEFAADGLRQHAQAWFNVLRGG